jgi:transposase
MPIYKDQLDEQARNFLNGFYANWLPSSELRKIENNLVIGLEKELPAITEKINQVMDQLNPTKYGDAAARRISFARYLALANLVGRLISRKGRLLRTHHQLIREQNMRGSLELFAFKLSPSSCTETDTLLPAFVCSSKTKGFFYSKLFIKHMDLTDDQWNVIRDLLPQKKMLGAGRPPQSIRSVLNGIFWKLRTAASWDDLPLKYPSHQTCYRYYTTWVRLGILEKVVDVLALHLSRSGFDLYGALQNNDIELIPLAKKTLIHFSPRWQNTWQSSTALLLIQLFINKKRKLGEPFQKIDQSCFE